MVCTVEDTEPSPVLGIHGLTGGLSNQRLAMLGLLSIARDEGAWARFPSQMVDFVPRLGSVEPERFLFPALFDLKWFRSALENEKVSGNPPTRVVPFSDAFIRGTAECFCEAPKPFVSRFMTGLRAAEPLRQIAKQIMGWLPMSRTVALQLRIERDWQEYLKRLSAEGRDNGSKECITDVDEIFRRIRGSQILEDYDTIWACCDESDLIITKKAIQESAARHGFSIFLHSDLPQGILMPRALLMQSMIDYTICSECSVYVGLERSTFSKTLGKTVGWLHQPARHFDYTLKSGKLGTIYDGTSTVPHVRL